MTMLVTSEPALGKIQKYLKNIGIKSSIPEQKLDFEEDYLDVDFLRTHDGMGNVGSLKLENSPIDYIHILKKQEYAKCGYTAGSHVGMGVHKHTWWKIRFFLVFPESTRLGPLDIGTITTIKKGLFHSEVEDFMWNGYQKLTTLPPGLVRDNVSDALYQDQKLKMLMTKCLLKERVITVSRYSPKDDTKTLKTNSKIVIESKWKLFKDIYLDSETIEMYERISKIVKKKVYELKYHLT
ncbi:MAG: hypothetical protein ACE5GR_02965 [Nitrosopumilus sp.]